MITFVDFVRKVSYSFREKVFIFICLGYLALIIFFADKIVFMGIVLLAILLGGVLFIKPAYGILAVMIGIFILDQLARRYSFLPIIVSGVKEIIIYFMFLSMLFKKTLSMKFARTPIDVPVILFLLVVIISTLINSISILEIFFGARHYLLYIILFYFIVNTKFDEKFYRNIIKTLFFIAFLSGPLAFIERYFLGLGKEDISAGFMSSGSFVLFGSAMFCLIFGCIAQNGLRFRYLAPLISLFMTALLAETKAFFFFVPICSLLQFRSRLIKQKKMILFMIILVAMIILSVSYATTYHPLTNLKTYFFSPKKAFWYLSLDTVAHGKPMNSLTSSSIYKNINLSRVSKIGYAASETKKSLLSLLFGYGPSRVSSYQNLKYNADSSWKAMQLDQVQFSKTIMELGYLGFILFLVVIYKIYRMNSAFYQNIPNTYWKVMSTGFRGIIFLFVIGAFYNNVWSIDVMAFTFWFLAAAIYSQYKK